MPATNSRAGANMRHLGGCRLATYSITASNAGYKQQGWANMRHLKGCRLATYSIYTGYKQQGWGQHEASWGL